MSITSRNTHRKVYELLAAGWLQPHLKRKLGLTRQAVSYHARKLVRDGYLRKIEGTSPAVYRVTSKPFPDNAHRVCPAPRHRMSTHHSSRKFEIVKPGNRPWGFIWDHVNDRPGVRFSYAKNVRIDTPEGTYLVKCIRLAEGKRKSSLTVWVDEQHVTTPEQIDAHQDFVNEISMLVVQALAKRTGTQFALPTIHQKTHFALPPGVWIDRSPPPVSLETDDPEIAKLLLQPEIELARLRHELNDMKLTLNEIVTVMEKQTAAVLSMDARIKALEIPAIPEDTYEGMYY